MITCAILFSPLSYASSSSLIGKDLSSFSVLAGGYTSYGANTEIAGKVGGVSYVTSGANSKSAEDSVGTTAVFKALEQLSIAKSSLYTLGQGTVLSPTLSGIVILKPGIYSASAITSAANTTLILDGDDKKNPFWIFNISTYFVTGAGTQ